MLIPDMPEAEYHRYPAFSATGAKLILDSPAKYRYRVMQRNTERKPAFDLGSAVHAKVLGTGWGIEELDFPDWRSKAARDARDAAYAADLIPMLSKDLDGVEAMAESVLANPTAKALLEIPGGREVSVIAELDGINVKSRFDALTDSTPQGRFGIDLKTSAGAAHKDAFARTVNDYGYHVQQEFYRDTYRASEGEEINFVFVVVEKEPPYLTAVHQLDVIYQQMGKTLAREARRIYAECKTSGDWPGYPADVQLVGPPTWAAIQHEEKYGG